MKLFDCINYTLGGDAVLFWCYCLTFQRSPPHRHPPNWVTRDHMTSENLQLGDGGGGHPTFGHCDVGWLQIFQCWVTQGRGSPTLKTNFAFSSDVQFPVQFTGVTGTSMFDMQNFLCQVTPPLPPHSLFEIGCHLTGLWPDTSAVMVLSFSPRVFHAVNMPVLTLGRKS